MRNGLTILAGIVSKPERRSAAKSLVSTRVETLPEEPAFEGVSPYSGAVLEFVCLELGLCAFHRV